MIPLVPSVEAPHPDAEAEPADLIAISGAITPEIAIKSPEAPDARAEQVASVAEVASEPARAEPVDLSVVSAAIATGTGDESQTATVPEAGESPVAGVAQPPAPVQPAAVAQPPVEAQPPMVAERGQQAQPVDVRHYAPPQQNGQNGHGGQQPHNGQPPVVHTVDDTQGRKVPSIERALSGPSKDRNLSWHGKVKIVTGTGATGAGRARPGGARPGPGAASAENPSASSCSAAPAARGRPSPR